MGTRERRRRIARRAQGALAVLAAVVGVSLLAGAVLSRGAEVERATGALSWTVREGVEQRLARSRALAGARVRAEESGGAIVLTGFVRDELQRERARGIAAQTPGVEEVRDELRVDASLAAPTVRDDGDVARDVAQKLSVESALDASAKQGWLYGWRVEGDDWALDVEVDDGDVLLEGVVLLQPHIHAFVLAAREVPGVRSVRSELQVRPNPAPAPPFDQ
jgi:osmotically-inducible protein OsmY